LLIYSKRSNDDRSILRTLSQLGAVFLLGLVWKLYFPKENKLISLKKYKSLGKIEFPN
jgi:hypothetical protein